jgi:hypothetical protein
LLKVIEGGVWVQQLKHLGFALTLLVGMTAKLFKSKGGKNKIMSFGHLKK